MDIDLTDRTVRLVRQLENIALELIRQHRTSRSALGSALGVSGNTVVNNLKAQRDEGDTTDPRWAFAVMEHFGIDPSSVLSGLCQADSPEVLLEALPVPGLTRAERKRRRRTKAYRRRRELLCAARRFVEEIPAAPEVFSKPWPERRFRDPDLEPVYRRLEELEEQRHRDAAGVESACHQIVTGESHPQTEVAACVLHVGALGIWGTVQRSRHRLDFAKQALNLSISAARKLGDRSLLADQLQRSAWVLEDLDASSLSVAMLREASECFRADGNQDGDGYALINRGSVAGNHGHLDLAERLFVTGLKLLSPSASFVFKSMAAEGVAICRDHKGDIEGALSFLTAAASRAEQLDSRFRARLLHTAANLLRKTSQLGDAETKYREALALVDDEFDPHVRLKLLVDLAVCLLKSGREDYLDEIVSEVKELLPKLRNQSFVQTQCQLLLRELSAEFVDLEALTRFRTAKPE